MELTENKNIIRTVKVLALALMSLLTLLIDFSLIQSALFTDKTLLFWIWPTLVTGLAIAFLMLFGLVSTNASYQRGMEALILIGYVAIFPKNWIVMLGGVVFVALVFLFERRIRTEERSRQNFSIQRVFAGSVAPIIYAVLLLLGINIYYNTSAEFKANPDGFYQAFGHSAAKSAAYLTRQGGGGVDLNQTLRQYLETETRKQVPDYDKIPADYRQEYLEQTKQQFFRQFNIQTSEDQPLSEVAATYAVERIRNSAEKYTGLFPLIFTVIIVGLLSTFSFLLRWLSLLLTWLIFRILFLLKFFRLSKVAIEVEKLEI